MAQCTTPNSSNRSLQTLLCAVGALTIVNLAVQVVSLSPQSAHAQNRSGPGSETAPPTPFPNQAENIRKLTEAMNDANARLGRIEAKLDKGINVKVTEMPAVEIKNPPKGE
ncbi:MAG: hypothetical protein KIT68_09285 [Phycisphaeraceae bacterium]|nr:hypothetical protein [Phycisphaeraceae bacterium]